MDLQQEVEKLRASLKEAEAVRADLDRHVFHLKTLYDVSKDIYSTVQTDTILRNFLLMSMGNFGVAAGFILLMDTGTKEALHFVNIGFQEQDRRSLQSAGERLLTQANIADWTENDRDVLELGILPPSIAFAMPFDADSAVLGLFGLGPKLIGDNYGGDDKELLDTLVNNLTVALRNARSFEEIQRLNMDLEAKNIELEKILKQLKASLRKIEILESVKANLSKFVPSTVTQLIDKSPTGAIPELQERDLSVLFLDIGGYTGLLERLGSSQVHSIIERHFSAFMDAIYANNGDVNETAGDGLMVLFLNEDREGNALEAVQTAIAIRERTVEIKEQFSELYRPLDINMGINSGSALVGAAKFDSLTGSRWTYTARGTLTNVAARISALGAKGSLLIARETADRISHHYTPVTRGKFQFKNVSEEVEVFEL
jgi:class 3 adenylate cyclase